MPSVQSEAISAIGNLCRATKEDFAPYFHTIIQGLLGILGSAATTETMNVHVAACVCLCRTQGRACEVASLVASMKDVVNKSEAWEIMQFLMNQVNNYSSGDELMNGLLDCMAEIFQYCETENKQQFLVVMIPKLIELTKTNVDYSLKQVVAGPEYQNENGVERLTMDTKNMGKVQMSINTTAIEVVSNAVRLIHNLIIDADSMMLPFISFKCCCDWCEFIEVRVEFGLEVGSEFI